MIGVLWISLPIYDLILYLKLQLFPQTMRDRHRRIQSVCDYCVGIGYSEKQDDQHSCIYMNGVTFPI